MENVSNAATSTDITNVLNILKTIAEFILDMIGSVVEVVMAQPLLLIPIGVVMLRTVISVFRSLF
jgi:hypothetical protein